MNASRHLRRIEGSTEGDCGSGGIGFGRVEALLLPSTFCWPRLDEGVMRANHSEPAGRLQRISSQKHKGFSLDLMAAPVGGSITLTYPYIAWLANYQIQQG